MGHIKSFLRKIIGKISLIIKPKKNLWVFGAWNGKLYADNPKYLFEYIEKEHPEIKVVWITRLQSVKKAMKNKRHRCYTRSSLMGIICALRAEAAFITSEETGEISPLINRRKTKIIQLWHGIAAKGLKFQMVSGKCENVDEKSAQRFREYYWMATSNEYQRVFEQILGVPHNRFAITGYPRNDTFINKPLNSNMEMLKKKYEGYKLIIYMPTHRNYGKKPIDIDEFDIIDKVLKDNNYIMVYKPHFNELKNIIDRESDFSNIILAKDQDVWGDVYSYIHYFDLLISDYSSIVYDFLCANKPIILYTYDLDSFKENDFGIMDYFYSVPAGPTCFTWNEVLNQMTKLLHDDTWMQKREKCRVMFHPFSDGCNSQRVYEAAKHFICQ